MAKTILGVDIGYDNLKLALIAGGVVRNAVSVPMPRNMIRDGHVVSVESMGEMIRTTMKENGMKARTAAFVFSNDSVYVKSISLPRMTADQLEYNLPFEFRDYITGEIREYAFDYAMYYDKNYDNEMTGQDGAEEGTPKMDMLACAAPRTVIEEARTIVRKAGLKLTMATPAVCTYMQLIRKKEELNPTGINEYCILDLGYQAVRMYIFKGERHVVTRVLDVGLSGLDQVLADVYGVDIHLAHTYLMTDYEHCTRREECLSAYDSIATELMRALNFFRFSNPDGNLEDVWLCGGGAKIEPLAEVIADNLDMRLHPASDLLPGGEMNKDAEIFVQAVGITLE